MILVDQSFIPFADAFSLDYNVRKNIETHACIVRDYWPKQIIKN